MAYALYTNGESGFSSVSRIRVCVDMANNVYTFQFDRYIRSHSPQFHTWQRLEKITMMMPSNRIREDSSCFE